MAPDVRNIKTTCKMPKECNIHLKQGLTQVLGRQVALGEDEEAPEDPGAVGLSNIVSLLTRNISNPV